MKFNLHNSLNLAVAEAIQKTIQDIYNITAPIENLYRLLVLPPNPKQGDLAFGCFLLAKDLKNSPAKIANELVSIADHCDLIHLAQGAGPYLNLFLNKNICNHMILDEVISKQIFQKPIVHQAAKTMIEFSQPNTHKELHVGHMRNLCFGDALVKIHRYCGVETLSTTFPGDVGTHVAKCLWYYKYHNADIPPQDRKGAWLGRLYTQANTLLEQQKGSEKESSNRQALTEILQQLHAGEGEFFDLWQETRAWSIELMQEIYDWAQVSFDSWYWESDVDASSVALIKEYQAKGLFVEDAGAVGINLEQDKLGFCLLLKSDGTGLYATKDIELARRKFQDYQIERSLYVVDNRQSLHFKQVFKTLEYMGFDQAKNCHHLQYEMVELSDGAMSSRKGNIVALQDLIDQMVTTIKQDYLNKYQSDWSEEQIESTANIIAAGAIKYGMNRTDANKKIVFDMQEWLKLDGESGPYIQYVYARITSMLKKHTQPADWNFASLEHARESAIINHLSFYNQTVQTCLEKGVTHTLCQYVYQLAKLYNSFYAECPVANASSESLKSARLGLSTAVANIIEHALGLLGISVPERM